VIFFLKNLIAKQLASLGSDSPHSGLLEKQVFHGSVLGKGCPKQGLTLMSSAMEEMLD
jgi:hypothetical protein